jgi:hypothetical protein
MRDGFREKPCFNSVPGSDPNAVTSPGGQHSFKFDLSDDYDPAPNAPATYGLQAIYTNGPNSEWSKWSRIVPITITQ